MKSYISVNIKYLYEQNNLTQNEFGELFGLKKGVIGTYVRGKTNPQVETIQKICEHFSISLDDFINTDLSKNKKYAAGDYYRDPVIGQLEQQALGGSMEGLIEIVNSLKKSLDDKDKIIQLLEEEIMRLRDDGNQNHISGNVS